MRWALAPALIAVLLTPASGSAGRYNTAPADVNYWFLRVTAEHEGL